MEEKKKGENGDAEGQQQRSGRGSRNAENHQPHN